MLVDWSPDGDYLVFAPGLNVMGPDGSGLTSIPVTGVAGDIESPTGPPRNLLKLADPDRLVVGAVVR